MRIHSLQYSPVFGYNKELNEKVNEKLRKTKGNKDFANTLLSLNTLCMKTEDNLRNAEAVNNRQLVEKYSSLLLRIKGVTVSQIHDRFPELDYMQKEYEWYKAEATKKNNNQNQCYWLNQIALVLNDTIKVDKELSKLVEKAKKDKSKNKNVFEPKNKIGIGQAGKTKNKTKLPEGANYVEEFVPGEYSAKGFNSIGGMDDLKDKLYDKIIMPLKDPQQAKLDFVEYGTRIPRGELLYGPPGCGKTYFAEAVAVETGLPMYKFKVSKVGSIYVDGKAINLQKAYDYLKSIAKDSGKPVIMFIDEMDSLTPKRDPSGDHPENNKAVDTFLQIMDEARNDNVFIIGATNLVDLIDPSVESRFDNKDYVGLPDADTRRQVLQLKLYHCIKGQALADNPVELEKVVNKTKGFSNRALEILTLEALNIARKDSRRDVTADDFDKPIAAHQDDIVRNENIYMAKSKAPAIGFNHTGR